MSDRPDIERLRALVEQMSPPRWRYFRQRNCIDTTQLDKDGNEHDYYSIGIVDDEPDDYLLPWLRDSAGIVALRNAAPALLDHIARLERALAQAAEALEEEAAESYPQGSPARTMLTRIAARWRAFLPGTKETDHGKP